MTAEVAPITICRMRVLVVEDDLKLRSLVQKALGQERVLADVAACGEDALWMAGSTRYDVIVLDLILPGIDGLETTRALRDDSVLAPIMILSACDAVDYRIAGLDGGADDYLTKPFDFSELAARLRALARRGPAGRRAALRVGDLTLDPATYGVRRGGSHIALTSKEVDLLEVFMRHPGEQLSRDRLLEGAWDAGHRHRSNVIDVYVRHLREKIDRPFGVETIETVHGVGYRLTVT